MKKDNLFDTRITPLDVVKILLLIVTMFSTWNIISLITPSVPLAWVRILAAVGMVEGAFLGFEYATKDARNKSQTRYATVGFFLSLTVIAVFAGVSGLLEFAGPELLDQSGGQFMGMELLVRDVVMISVLVVLVIWIFALAAIYRMYSLEDPDKKAELERNQIEGDLKTASNDAYRDAMKSATPVVTIQRAVAAIRANHQHEFSPSQLELLVRDVERRLRETVHGTPAPAMQYNFDASVPVPAPAPLPLQTDGTMPRPVLAPLSRSPMSDIPSRIGAAAAALKDRANLTAGRLQSEYLQSHRDIPYTLAEFRSLLSDQADVVTAWIEHSRNAQWAYETLKDYLPKDLTYLNFCVIYTEIMAPTVSSVGSDKESALPADAAFPGAKKTD